ncbi:hypothetical protein ACFU9F_22620 [Streptomyces zhihengii]|uniref:Pycsar effector protein domain-containing protein n=1 Tax=Streptomyces zhihengii TaxID=1818004 RepID=A0ABS2URN7_9ACTN|nr:hypothetical protein [Streptomyces zhihengii]MBM9620221.1 hypothetical protein [Streptomyces zhihengii]
MEPAGHAVGNRPAQYMFAALHATHQQADAKAGILAAAQAALAGTAGAWTRQAVLLWDRGGASGAFAGVLLALFVCGLAGGVVSLAAALSPRLLRDGGVNRYSFVHLASGPDILPAEDAPGAASRGASGGGAAAGGASGGGGAGGAAGGASGGGGAADVSGDEAAERRELSLTVRFLAHVAVRKYRCLTVAVACTAAMGVSAGLGVVLLPGAA